MTTIDRHKKFLKKRLGMKEITKSHYAKITRLLSDRRFLKQVDGIRNKYNISKTKDRKEIAMFCADKEIEEIDKGTWKYLGLGDFEMFNEDLSRLIREFKIDLRFRGLVKDFILFNSTFYRIDLEKTTFAFDEITQKPVMIIGKTIKKMKNYIFHTKNGRMFIEIFADTKKCDLQDKELWERVKNFQKKLTQIKYESVGLRNELERKMVRNLFSQGKTNQQIAKDVGKFRREEALLKILGNAKKKKYDDEVKNGEFLNKNIATFKKAEKKYKKITEDNIRLIRRRMKANGEI